MVDQRARRQWFLGLAGHIRQGLPTLAQVQSEITSRMLLGQPTGHPVAEVLCAAYGVPVPVRVKYVDGVLRGADTQISELFELLPVYSCHVCDRMPMSYLGAIECLLRHGWTSEQIAQYTEDFLKPEPVKVGATPTPGRKEWWGFIRSLLQRKSNFPRATR